MTMLLSAAFERLASPEDYSGDVLEVQFNPTEYTLNKGAQLAEVPIPGLDQPIIQFVRGHTETMSLELFFDSTENGTGRGSDLVTDLTDDFYELIKIDPHTHAPPCCCFAGGRRSRVSVTRSNAWSPASGSNSRCSARTAFH